MGTTSIGFNLFLGGAMAEGKEIKGAQRGIAFSTGSALIVSILILIVGSGAGEAIDGAFKIGQLSGVIREQLGEAGVVVFALGFIAAALSSMLTVPLGAALTADSVFSSAPEARAEAIGTDNPNFADDEGQEKKKASGVALDMGEKGEGKRLPRWIYLSIMFVMVTVATVVISANGE